MDKTIKYFTSSKRVESSLIIEDCINRTWTVLKDKTKVHEMSNSIGYYLKLLQLLHISVTNQPPIQLTSKDLITNNFYKSITYVFQVLNITSVFKFMLYPNTLDSTTLLLLEIEYEASEEQEVNAFFKDTSAEYLEALSHFLKTNSAFLYENQSILINCSLAKMWNCIVNMKQLESISHSGPAKLFEEVKKIGDRFTYTINNEVRYAKLCVCDRENAKKWTFAFELYDAKYTQLLCLVSFFFLYINENMVFISYNHDFKEPIEQSNLNEISQRKKEFLNDMKVHMEKQHG